MRTLVISDAHGCPQVIQNALDHARFEPGCDGFVYAGDLLDRGPDAAGCIALVERYATEVLFGNHDVAALFGFYIYPQNRDSPSYRPLLVERALAADEAKAWKAATCVEGVLITHAGVSADYERLFLAECRSDPVLLAERLNAEFQALVRRDPPPGDWYEHPLLDDHGPFWFRPWPLSTLMPLRGCVQVAGHTPPYSSALRDLEKIGFYMIDPSSFDPFEGYCNFDRYRYALIEGGRVTVQDGTVTANDAGLDAASSARPPKNSGSAPST